MSETNQEHLWTAFLLRWCPKDETGTQFVDDLIVLAEKIAEEERARNEASFAQYEKILLAQAKG